jgi:peptide/nickel transport system ATP-binding protein
MALLANSELIIADEPTSALDPITGGEIVCLLLQSIQQNQMSGIIITHDLHTALQCDKILVIAEGHPVAYGPTLDAIQQSSHSFCQQLASLIIDKKRVQEIYNTETDEQLVESIR